MTTTGNAGGNHNLIVKSGEHDLNGLLKQMGKGLLVTELLGHGLNMVTGDYSRGAAGFWVEHGEIQHAVEEITIASNLKDMFLGIQAVGNDVLVLLGAQRQALRLRAGEVADDVPHQPAPAATYIQHFLIFSNMPEAADALQFVFLCLFQRGCGFPYATAVGAVVRIQKKCEKIVINVVVCLDVLLGRHSNSSILGFT